MSSVTGGGAIYVHGGQADLLSCLFAGNSVTDINPGYGGAVWADFDVTDILIGNCTFWANGTAELTSGTVHLGGAAATIERSIVAGTTQGAAVVGGPVVLSCSDLFGNAGGDWVGSIAAQQGINGNFSADPQFCNPITYAFGLQPLSPCLPGGNSCGQLVGAIGTACSTVGGGMVTDDRLATLMLAPSRPNPTDAHTTISYSLPRRGPVRLSLYDVAGRRIRALVSRVENEGWHSVQWDGRDHDGQSVASGIYFLRLEADGEVQTRKVVRLRE